MEIRCERCNAAYEVKDESLGAAGLGVRCSRCGHNFRVRKPPAPPPSQSLLVRKHRTGEVYACADLALLKRWAGERRAVREDELSAGGGPWRKLGDLPELAGAFALAEARRRAASAGAAPSDGAATGNPPESDGAVRSSPRGPAHRDRLSCSHREAGPGWRAARPTGSGSSRPAELAPFRAGFHPGAGHGPAARCLA